jgi:hypothetical protein
VLRRTGAPIHSSHPSSPCSDAASRLDATTNWDTVGNLQPASVNAGHAERPLQVHQRTRLDSAEIDGRRFQARSLHNLVSHYPKPARFLSMVEWFVSHHQKELALIPILA